MTSQTIDLRLPKSVPEVQWHKDASTDAMPFAVYTLVDLDDQQLDRILYECERKAREDCGLENRLRTSPEFHFPRQSLRSIIQKHIEVGRGGELDPTYFIVVADPDWRERGVLLVTLDDSEDFACTPDFLWSKAEEASLVLANLQICNTDWFEAKEAVGDDPTKSRRDDDDEVDDDEQGTEPLP